MIFLKIFIIFTKIGTFNFGGGYAMLSLIHNEVVVKNQWMTNAEFTDIVAISQSTPGPIGINAATYAGYTSVLHAGYPEWAAVLGSVLASLSIIWLPFIIMILISRYLITHKDSKIVKDDPLTFYISVAIFAVSFVLTHRKIANPILIMLLCGLAGVVVY